MFPPPVMIASFFRSISLLKPLQFAVVDSQQQIHGPWPSSQMMATFFQ
jgi:hypothetical protein